MFSIVSTILFGLLFVIWNGRDDVYNYLIKAVFLGMTFWGAFETLKAAGYIVKAL